MIKPTVGRVVHYFPGPDDPGPDTHGEPLAAIIAKVHSTTVVNLCVIHADGGMFPRTSVLLVQDGTPDATHSYATWMDYQKGQAPASAAVMESVRKLEAHVKSLFGIAHGEPLPEIPVVPVPASPPAADQPKLESQNSESAPAASTEATAESAGAAETTNSSTQHDPAES